MDQLKTGEVISKRRKELGLTQNQLAKCGYAVTAFDLSEQGIEKAKKLAEHNKVEVRLFKADIFDYHPDSEYDIIFSSGVLHFLPDARRKELCHSLKAYTADGGINVLNVFVQ